MNAVFSIFLGIEHQSSNDAKSTWVKLYEEQSILYNPKEFLGYESKGGLAGS